MKKTRVVPPRKWPRPEYAARYALVAAFGGSRHSTTATYASRIKRAWRFWRATTAIRRWCDLRLADFQAFAAHIAESVSGGELALATGKNVISALNCVARILLGHERFWINPTDVVGRRTYLRTEAPGAIQSPDALDVAVHQITGAGHIRAGLVIELARTLGVRVREACLLDCVAALAEARKGRVRIHRGTKGGAGKRRLRFVEADEQVLRVLERAAALQGDAKNLVDRVKLVSFMQHVRDVALPRLHAMGLGRIHDLRAAKACELYEHLTGFPAPVVAGRRVAPKEIDKAARKIIAEILGHGRIQIVSSYCGSAR